MHLWCLSFVEGLQELGALWVCLLTSAIPMKGLAASKSLWPADFDAPIIFHGQPFISVVHKITFWQRQYVCPCCN